MCNKASKAMTNPVDRSPAPGSADAIRPLLSADVPALKGVIDATALFPSEMLDDMMSGYFNGAADQEIWLTFDVDGPIALAYCAPERMTLGCWNLLLIAVHPSHQGRRIGAEMMAHTERTLAARGERILLVETSGLPEFERTRRFYRRIGYGEEARVRDYYQAGEDKIIFRKVLS